LILLFNAALGLYQEQRSEAALARLKALAGAQAWVLRDGEFVRLPTHNIVPGDWVRLESGDRVPADGVLRDPHGAMLDESILTGESVPIDKGQGEEAFSGTLLVRGNTLLEVTRIRESNVRARAQYPNFVAQPPDALREYHVPLESGHSSEPGAVVHLADDGEGNRFPVSHLRPRSRELDSR
jgi:P-type E1-E2 ATPase